MRLTRLTLAAPAGVAAILLGGLLGATALGASAHRVVACRPQQLSVLMSHISGSDGAGQTGYALAIHNRGSSSCSLGDHPRLTLLGANGKPLRTNAVPRGRNATVTLPPRGSKSLTLRFSPDVSGPGESRTGRCEPVAFKIRVALTAPAHGSIVGPVKPPTSVCEHGGMNERPL